MNLSDVLLGVERNLWSGGADEYRENVDDDCLVAFTKMAGVSSREEVASTVGDAQRWKDLKLQVEGILQPTDNVAIVTYRASAVRGADETYHALVSSGYVRRGDAR